MDELTTKVNNLGAGITDFKYENGQLVIVTDKGTNFTVDMPECEGIVKLEIKDGVLYADGVAVGNVSGDGGSVVEVKDGVIYIDGKAAGELGNKVAVTDNGNGTYTLTVDGKEYVLPKASSSVSVSLIKEGDNYFTNFTYADATSGLNLGGIVWGKASEYDGKWKGLKSVAKDGLLVGKINTVTVQVIPAEFDLTTAKLTLVNTLGKEAPVKVTPVVAADGLGHTGTRAAKPAGQWDLEVAMDETITLDNIGTAFATEIEYNVFKNVSYALAVDGKVVTPYNIVVDTQEAAEDEAFKFDNRTAQAAATEFYVEASKDGENALSVAGTLAENQTVLPLGEVTLKLIATETSEKQNKSVEELDKVYDAYIELSNTDLVESKDITASGMTIKTTDKAATVSGVKFRVHVLDVMGNESVSREYEVKFASSTVEGEAIEDQTCTIMPSQDYIVVDLGNTFTGLTAEQAEAISSVDDASKAVKWTVAKGAKTFADGDITNAVYYFASEADVNDTDKAIKVRDGETSTIRTIRYARISLTNATAGQGALKANDAEVGDNKLTLTLSDASSNEIKKVSAIITTALPKFDDVIAANTEYSLWDGNTFTTRMAYDGNANGMLPIENAFVSKKNAAGNKYFATLESMDYKVTYIDANGKEVEVNEADLTSLKDTKNSTWKANEFSVTASINVVANQSKLSVSKDFSVKMLSLFEGAKVVYYDPTTNAIVDVATVPTDRIFKTGSVDKETGKKSGLFITIDKYEVPFNAGNLTVGGYSMFYGDSPINNDMDITYTMKAVENGNGTPVQNENGNGIKINDISADMKGGIVFTYTDRGGIKTTSELKYEL